jgi:hypothetical protein
MVQLTSELVRSLDEPAARRGLATVPHPDQDEALSVFVHVLAARESG